MCLLSALGCTGSRWAREDPDYADKYPHHTDNVLRMTKQAFDARHVIGKRGVYGGFAGSDDPAGAGAEGGLFVYPRSWMEWRVGGAVLAHDGEHPLSGGGILGARVQTPTRLAPFAGLGGYAGWAGVHSANNDGIDNDADGDIDEIGERDLDFVVALAPEVGVHYWLTSRVRLTGGVDYRLVVDDPGDDSLFYGVSLAVLGADQRTPRKAPPWRSDADWKFSPGDKAMPLFESPIELPALDANTLPEAPGGIVGQSGAVQ